uniref:Ras GTPase-activating protein 4 n=1 Tax=Panthera tigris altaica TaxID=74533 RepID=A0A8C9JQW9_PANTA
ELRGTALGVWPELGEALPTQDLSGSGSGPQVLRVLSCRTATVWKTLCPFWGEEYQVHLPPAFHAVAFYVMDEDALRWVGPHSLAGAQTPPPAHFTAGTAGRGAVHSYPVGPDDPRNGHVTSGCSTFPRDLAPKDRNGASDPFVRVRYSGRTQETSIVKKSRYPRWNEMFEFELEEGAAEALCVEAWDWDLVTRKWGISSVPHLGWFTLSAARSRGNLGSLQLEVRLRDETVLPSGCYQPLVQLLCREVKLGTQGPGQLIALIEETTSTECRQDVATNLLKLFLGQGLAKDFLDLLFQLELGRTSEANTLFRSNSLASKSMESFLKVAGMRYLHGVLGPIIDKVFEEKKYVELDPSKVEVKDVGCSGLHRPQTEAEVLEQSARTLNTCSTALYSLQSVFTGTDLVWMRKRVSEGQEVPQGRVASPALLTPRLGWSHPVEQADIKLAAVQNVGNMDTPASRVVCPALCLRAPPASAPLWLRPRPLGHSLLQLGLSAHILPSLPCPPELGLQRALSLQAPPVKEGPLFIHRTKGKGPLMSSFKKLHFSLTTEALSFAKTPNSKCVNELNQWLSALRKVSIGNPGLLGSYHPGVFRGDKWSCCHQKDKSDLGCDKTRSRVTLQEWNDPLDHDLEAQLIYRHLLGVEPALREKHRELSAGTEAGSVLTGPGGAPEDPLAQLLQVLRDLQEAHRASPASSPPSEPSCLLELQR